MAIENENLITLTADIVAAHVSNNSVSTSDVGTLIEKVYGALQGLSAPTAPAEEEKPKGAVSIRASIKPDHLISMIDGKPYKMLRRHLTFHGYTPETYRAAYGLPVDYPIVAASYAAQRRDLAKRIGLGRKRKEVTPAPVVETAKPVRTPRAKKAAPAPAEA